MPHLGVVGTRCKGCHDSRVGPGSAIIVLCYEHVLVVGPEQAKKAIGTALRLDGVRIRRGDRESVHVSLVRTRECAGNRRTVYLDCLHARLRPRTPH